MNAMTSLLEAVEDITGGSPKVPRTAYQRLGRLPVVDQGKSLIAGYTDNCDDAFRHDGPHIVFGDHTRSVKFVDFPFAMGADGVKVLRARRGFDPKYVYHYLRTVRLPDAGYSRHFKFLKGVELPKPPLDQQRCIAAILDHVEATREKYRQIIVDIDRLAEAVFNAMFQTASSNHHDWPTVRLGDVVPTIDSGTSPVCEQRPAQDSEWGVLKLGAVSYRRFDPEENKAFLGDVASIRKVEVKPGDLLFSRKNTKELVGVTAIAYDPPPRKLLPDLIFRLNFDQSRATAEYLHSLLTSRYKRPSVVALASGSASSMSNISKSRLAELPIELPPIDLQLAYADRLRGITRLRDRYLYVNGEVDELFASLQSRAFSGQL